MASRKESESQTSERDFNEKTQYGVPKDARVSSICNKTGCREDTTYDIPTDARVSSFSNKTGCREDLPMHEIQQSISNRINFLSSVLKDCEQSLRIAPEGRLRATHVGNKISFYYRKKPDERAGKYIKKGDDALVRALAQKEYVEKVAKAAKNEIGQLQALSAFFQHSTVESADQLLHESKRNKINPLFLSDKEYIEKWQSQEFEKFDCDADEDLLSDRGEKMRSKSELLIANALNRRNIPYFYEKPHVIDGKTIHPDFTLLNIRLRREYIWEHFGMMSDKKYAETALVKLNRYMANGYLPGKNLIITAESESVKLGTRQIETIISGYLL